MQSFMQNFGKSSAVSGDGGKALRSAVRKAWLIIFFERFWRRFSPLLVVSCLFFSCCWLNIFTFLPVFLHILLLAVFALLFAAAGIVLILLPVPSAAEARARVARDNALLFGQMELEEQLLAEPASKPAQALWQEHKKRLRQQISELSGSAPRPDIPRYDSFGARAFAFLLFAVAFGFQTGSSGGRLSDAFYFGAWQPPSAIRADAWINPPHYTGRAPLYLLADNQSIAAIGDFSVYDAEGKMADADSGAAGNLTESGDIAAKTAEKELNAPLIVPSGSRLTIRVNDNGRGLGSVMCIEKIAKPSVFSVFAAPVEKAALPQAADFQEAEVKRRLQPRREGVSSVYQTELRHSALCSMTTPQLHKSWVIVTESDKAPQIHWLQAPERALNGVLKLRYDVYDDYGVKKAWAESVLREDSEPNSSLYPYFAKLTAKALRRREKDKGGAVIALQGRQLSPAEKIIPKAEALQELPKISLNLPPPLRGGSADLRGGKAVTESDVSKNPWAGAAVTMRLAAEDAAGQIARSAPRHLALPQKIFVNPLARALAEQRRIITENGFAAVPRFADMLKVWLLWPEKVITDKGTALAFYSLQARLQRLQALSQAAAAAQTQAQMQTERENGRQALRDIADYMWAIADGIDGSKLAEAERRLKLAQQALRAALRSGAEQREIAKLMQDLRDAMQDYIAMLAERGQNAAEDGKDKQMLGENELEKRLKALEEAAKGGNRGLGEQLLSELEDLMKDLQVTQGGRGGSSAFGKNGKQAEMQKQMDSLSDIMRRQQQLLDDTHKFNERNLQDMQEPQQQTEGQSDGTGTANQRQKRTAEQEKTGKIVSPNQQIQSLQNRQSDLQKDLLDLQEALKNKGLLPKNALNEAERQMENAARALRQGDAEQGQENQAQSLQALRDDAQNVMKQMRAELQKAEAERQARDGREGNALGETAEDGGSRDPLGRAFGTGQTGGDWGTQQDMAQRARRILEEIRKKLGALTPSQEKEYLERLLNYE